ncbi:MAG: hypothetical protein K2X07_05055 [Caulobacteraceae bacterium]|nr:hypothetical protein [Caulobacteraceae bacterium]
MQRTVVLDDELDADLRALATVEFTLVYAGPLRATQGDPQPGSSQRTRHADLKHQMRMEFSRQLKTLWDVVPQFQVAQQIERHPFNIERSKALFQILPWCFVPVVNKAGSLCASLDITLLRRDHPGPSVWRPSAGDIDNRLKTLIDALRMPNAHDGYSTRTPDGDGTLYCLLEDDDLVTGLSINTDRLLAAPDDADLSYAHVTVRVKLRLARDHIPL